MNEIVLLDGGMGQELRRRSPNEPTSMWSAQAMVENPALVQEVHEDYIRAGAQVITTNTYATVKWRLEDAAGLGHKFEELVNLGGQLANQARDATGADVLIAGSLPPLFGSYRPDLVRDVNEIEPIYREHVDILAPYVDVFICETMSSAQEAYAATHVALTAGKPVWTAWTLQDNEEKRLRSGETLPQAWDAIKTLPLQAVLLNCSSPESITAAMPDLLALGVPIAGGYANGFTEIPEKWTVKEQGIHALGERHDLDPKAYAAYVQDWIAAGAGIVGGCCQVGPEHIQYLSEMLKTHKRI